MGEMRGQWVPETDAEYQFIMALYNLAHQAADELELDDETINGAMSAVALQIGHGPENDAEERAAAEPVQIKDCPQCGTEIERALASLGGEVQVLPCGCSVQYHRVPGWVDDPGDDDG